MDIVEAFERVKRRKKPRKYSDNTDDDDNNVVVVANAPLSSQDRSLVVATIDTSELSREFSEAKKSFSESLTKKRKLENELSPLIETFTDTWSKKLNHFRKRGRNGFEYVASNDAKTYLAIIRMGEQTITEKRRLQYLNRKTANSDVVKVHKQLLQLGKTAANLPTPFQLLIQNSTNNETTVVMSTDFKALTPSDTHVCHGRHLSDEAYQRVQTRKKDVELHICDADVKISKLHQSLGDDDSENFDKVRQREFRHEHRHERFTYTQYCLCFFCTKDIFHLNEMLEP
jgi:hypothetical protein